MNEVTIKDDSHAFPRIDETLDALNGLQWLSTLDLKSGYWQVPIAEKDRCKTAFSILGGGLWQFKVMTFGLKNAPAPFARMMERIFRVVLENLHGLSGRYYSVFKII